MPVGSHRFAEERWSGVFGEVLRSPRRRIRLVREPERAGAVWGFCEGGVAFLRLLNALAALYGEAPIQRYTDDFLGLYSRQPDSIAACVGLIAESLAKDEVASNLNWLAVGLGYSAVGRSGARGDRAT